MANVTRKPKSNAYKKGKLSKNARFSPRRIKWTPIIVILCVLATFIFAVILGNILGKKAEGSKNTTSSSQNVSNITPPSANKVSPKSKLHAYTVDLTNADPQISLSEFTGNARKQGNALFVEFKNQSDKIFYTSDKTQELEFECQENLTLSRFANHLEYYDDFAIGYFKSEFSANLNEEKALKLQTNEILLLKEATDTAFDQIIIEFSGEITKNTLIYYQTYLLNLKLACPTTPVGIKLSQSFLNDSNNAGSISSLLGIADFFVLDLANKDAKGIESTLDSMIYFAERYNCVVVISNDENIADKISVLDNKGVENCIVK